MNIVLCFVVELAELAILLSLLLQVLFDFLSVFRRFMKFFLLHLHLLVELQLDLLVDLGPVVVFDEVTHFLLEFVERLHSLHVFHLELNLLLSLLLEVKFVPIDLSLKHVADLLKVN